MAEWTLVARKRGHRQETDVAAVNPAKVHMLPKRMDEKNVDLDSVRKIKKSIEASLESVGELTFTAALLSALKVKSSWSELVCYGVGPVTSSARSRVQFALAEFLRQHLDVSVASCFDPACSATDKAIFEQFGWTVLTKDEEGKRKARCEIQYGLEAEEVDSSSSRAGTVFFMPHCPFRLYSNVLWANWPQLSPPVGSAPITHNIQGAGLKDLAIIGNSFAAYDVRAVGSSVRPSNCVLRLLPYTTEIPLSSTIVGNDPHFGPSLSSADIGVCVVQTAATRTRDEELVGRHGVGPEVYLDL